MIMAALRAAESSGGVRYTRLCEATGIPDTSVPATSKKLIADDENLPFGTHSLLPVESKKRQEMERSRLTAHFYSQITAKPFSK
jgi:hypothetical protein